MKEDFCEEAKMTCGHVLRELLVPGWLSVNLVKNELLRSLLEGKEQEWSADVFEEMNITATDACNLQQGGRYCALTENLDVKTVIFIDEDEESIIVLGIDSDRETEEKLRHAIKD